MLHTETLEYTVYAAFPKYYVYFCQFRYLCVCYM